MHNDDGHSTVTLLLAAAARGDVGAHERLWAAIYAELRSMARAQLAQESPGHTLQPTALVHEAWFRLQRGGNPAWDSRRHFFGAAAEAMRQILVEGARKKRRLKRGGGWSRQPLQTVDQDPDSRWLDDPDELLALNEALDAYAAMDPKRAEVVKLRFFAGLTVDETAEVLGIASRTVEKYWSLARAWLHRKLSQPPQC